MNQDPNVALMTSIRARFGAVIEQACATSSVVPAFLAALVANESGGDPHATRFEKDVFTHIWEVLAGRKAAFGSIQRAALLAFIDAPSAAAPGNKILVAAALERLDHLATSWGLTQVMGYVSEADGTPKLIHQDPAALVDPTANLEEAIKCLAQFANRFQLDVHNEFEQLLRCWNSGQPDGATFDPGYVSKGLARMAIYSQLS